MGLFCSVLYTGEVSALLPLVCPALSISSSALVVFQTPLGKGCARQFVTKRVHRAFHGNKQNQPALEPTEPRHPSVLFPNNGLHSHFPAVLGVFQVCRQQKGKREDIWLVIITVSQDWALQGLACLGSPCWRVGWVFHRCLQWQKEGEVRLSAKAAASPLGNQSTALQGHGPLCLAQLLCPFSAPCTDF